MSVSLCLAKWMVGRCCFFGGDKNCRTLSSDERTVQSFRSYVIMSEPTCWSIVDMIDMLVFDWTRYILFPEPSG